MRKFIKRLSWAYASLGLGLLACASALPAGGQPAAPPPTYTNPVGGADVQMGDPFVLFNDGRYYLYGTTANDGFKYWTSPDLVNWTAGGYAYQRAADAPQAGSYWAPEVIRHQDKFYMVYSCEPKVPQGEKKFFRMNLAVSDRPEGPFTDLHAPWLPYAYSTIDGDIFVDDDGTPYLYFAAVGKREKPETYIYGLIYGVELERDLSAPVGPVFRCTEASQDWENPFSTDTRCNEGAFVFKRGSTYYMTYSANRWNDPFYSIGCATATAPRGPWTKPATNPLVGEDKKIGLSGPGHSCMVPSPDGSEMFIVYHAHVNPDKPGARNVNIDRVVFDEKGAMRVTPTRSPQPMPSAKKPAQPLSAK